MAGVAGSYAHEPRSAWWNFSLLMVIRLAVITSMGIGRKPAMTLKWHSRTGREFGWKRNAGQVGINLFRWQENHMATKVSRNPVNHVCRTCKWAEFQFSGSTKSRILMQAGRCTYPITMPLLPISVISMGEPRKSAVWPDENMHCPVWSEGSVDLLCKAAERKGRE